jgi:DUF177 domain-containing protein
MKILLNDITGEGSRYKLEESYDFSSENLEVKAPLQARFTVMRQDDDLYSLIGDFQVRLVTSCDRCGKRIEIELEQDFSYVLSLEDEPQMPSEYDSSEEDCEVIYLSQPFIETSAILSEQLLLAMPLHRLCDTACKGLCNNCGVNLNTTTCQCRENNINSPFAILKNLKK